MSTFMNNYTSNRLSNITLNSNSNSKTSGVNPKELLKVDPEKLLDNELYRLASVLEDIIYSKNKKDKKLIRDLERLYSRVQSEKENRGLSIIPTREYYNKRLNALAGISALPENGAPKNQIFIRRRKYRKGHSSTRCKGNTTCTISGGKKRRKTKRKNRRTKRKN